MGGIYLFFLLILLLCIILSITLVSFNRRNICGGVDTRALSVENGKWGRVKRGGERSKLEIQKDGDLIKQSESDILALNNELDIIKYTIQQFEDNLEELQLEAEIIMEEAREYAPNFQQGAQITEISDIIKTNESEIEKLSKQLSELSSNDCQNIITYQDLDGIIDVFTKKHKYYQNHKSNNAEYKRNFSKNMTDTKLQLLKIKEILFSKKIYKDKIKEIQAAKSLIMQCNELYNGNFKLGNTHDKRDYKKDYIIDLVKPIFDKIDKYLECLNSQLKNRELLKRLEALKLELLGQNRQYGDQLYELKMQEQLELDTIKQENEQKIEQKIEQIKQIKQQIEEKKIRLKELEIEIGQKMEQKQLAISRLLGDKEEMKAQKDMKDAQDRKNEQDREIRILELKLEQKKQREISKINDELAERKKLEDRIEQLQKQISKYIEKNNKILKDLNTCTQSSTILENNIKKLTKENNELTINYNDLKEKTLEVYAKYSESSLQDENVKLLDKITTLETALEETKARLMGYISNMKLDAKANLALIEQIKQENEKLKKDEDSKEEQIIDLKNENEELKNATNIEYLKQEISYLGENIVKLKKENEELSTKKLKQKYGDIKKEYDGLKKDIEELLEKNSKLLIKQAQLEEINFDLNHLWHKNTELEEKNEKYLHMIDQLATKLIELKGALEKAAIM